ncbi:MAG: hypothetical protein NTX04_01960, partial [Verrucomicrobia bacterium]|nr:hypothetical protein [Verrucomicrobiota bacterium]
MSALYNLRAFKAAFALAHLLPRPVAQSLARLLSQLIYRKNSLTQSALQSNLHQITGLSGNQLHHLCLANVSLFGQMLADYFLCAGPRAARHCHSLIDSWSGLENLQASHQSGRGTIIVTGHLGHWELGGIALTQIPLPLTVVTLEEPSTELTPWRQAGRQRLGIKTIVVGPAYPFAFIELIQTLRRNELVA